MLRRVRGCSFEVACLPLCTSRSSKLAIWSQTFRLHSTAVRVRENSCVRLPFSALVLREVSAQKHSRHNEFSFALSTLSLRKLFEQNCTYAEETCTDFYSRPTSITRMTMEALGGKLPIDGSEPIHSGHFMKSQVRMSCDKGFTENIASGTPGKWAYRRLLFRRRWRGRCDDKWRYRRLRRHQTDK